MLQGGALRQGDLWPDNPGPLDDSRTSWIGIRRGGHDRLSSGTLRIPPILMPMPLQDSATSTWTNSRPERISRQSRPLPDARRQVTSRFTGGGGSCRLPAAFTWTGFIRQAAFTTHSSYHRQVAGHPGRCDPRTRAAGGGNSNLLSGRKICSVGDGRRR